MQKFTKNQDCTEGRKTEVRSIKGRIFFYLFCYIKIILYICVTITKFKTTSIMNQSDKLLRLKELKEGDLVTFYSGSISWSPSVYTISKVTDKAIKVNNEWIPKSQILDCPFTKRNHEVYDNELARSGKYPFRTEKVEVLELLINEWFDKKNNSKRSKNWAF